MQMVENCTSLYVVKKKFTKKIKLFRTQIQILDSPDPKGLKFSDPTVSGSGLIKH